MNRQEAVYTLTYTPYDPILCCMPEMVRIDPAAHAALSEVAKARGIPLAEAMRRAVELLRRELFIEQMNAGYAAMRADGDAWAEEQAERAVWDRTNVDGLDRE